MDLSMKRPVTQVQVWNMRLRLQQLCGALRELARYGPMKPVDKAGLDEVAEKYEARHIEKNDCYQADPTGVRTGNGVGQQLSDTIEQVCRDTEAVLQKDNVTRKIPTSKAILQEKLDNMRGVVIMAYPMGLPAWDTVRLSIESENGLEGTAAGQELLDENTAELWVASRSFDRNQTVGDRLGKNEKTKVIGKLQKAGGGPPGREPVVDEEEKKAMMAFYFKKQEEMKRLAENNEDDYLNSSWADPKQLQKSMRGVGVVKAPGIR
eukprot:gene708-1360_t